MQKIVLNIEMEKAEASAQRPRESGTSTLDLALRAVELLALRHAPMSLGEIAKALGATKPTIYRHLTTLIRHGFAWQDARTGYYAAGVKLMTLGEAVQQQFDVIATSKPHLIQLRDKTSQSATICTLVGEELIVMERVEGRSIIEFGTPRGTRFDFHASAHGRVWLAFGPHELTDKVLAGPLKSWSGEVRTSVPTIRREIELIRARGWAMAPNEMVDGVNALAAPVFDHRGELIASVAIVGSLQFIPSPPLPEQIDAVVQCARAVSSACGWRR
ncbi:IclR family transcriptional regulator [Solimonas marina]|uniref:HTH-type transcriptional repressor AllR n=1 Tax=Solimonas marina TaxID=2714601 RepID=A0A969WF09_9GAMM|nr:IclR family transcriptional regulator [Solimonas marina]NKF24121.1 IclR family transcriptional regulator [Solimonas marina]